MKPANFTFPISSSSPPTMKPLIFFSFFLFFSLSHSQRLEFREFVPDLTTVTIKPDLDHHHHHENQGSVTSSGDRAVDDIIFVSDLTAAAVSSEIKPAVIEEERVNKLPPDVTRLDLRYFGNHRRPVRLTNRFPFSRPFRFFPRRCHHRHPDRRFGQWGPAGDMDQNVVQFMFKKDGIEKQKHRVVPDGRNEPYSEILKHRHVARKFPEGDHHVREEEGVAAGMMMFNRPHFIGQIPRSRPLYHHHHDHDHDDSEDLRVVFDRVKEVKHHHDHDEKEMSDDQKEGEKGKNHHHDDHDGHEERGNEVLKKIRKFLGYF